MFSRWLHARGGPFPAARSSPSLPCLHPGGGRRNWTRRWPWLAGAARGAGGRSRPCLPPSFHSRRHDRLSQRPARDGCCVAPPLLRCPDGGRTGGSARARTRARTDGRTGRLAAPPLFAPVAPTPRHPAWGTVAGGRRDTRRVITRGGGGLATAGPSVGSVLYLRASHPPYPFKPMLRSILRATSALFPRQGHQDRRKPARDLNGGANLTAPTPTASWSGSSRRDSQRLSSRTPLASDCGSALRVASLP